jgi:hypothetical protein
MLRNTSDLKNSTAANEKSLEVRLAHAATGGAAIRQDWNPEILDLGFAHLFLNLLFAVGRASVRAAR